LIINKEESKLLSDEEEKRDIIKFFKDSPLKNIIITLGENGVIIICESNIIKVPALKVKVKDTTGGGDVFTAVFTASILSHLNIKTACKRAVRAASIAITQEGSSDALPSKEELKIIMENT